MLNTRNIVRKAGIIIPAFLFLYFTNCNNHSPQHNYQSVRLNYHIDAIDNKTKKIVQLNDSLDIFYCGKYIIYQLPYRFKKQRDSKNSAGKITSVIVGSGINYHYMIYNKYKNYGYIFDSLTAIQYKKIPVDSFLIKRSFKTFPFYIKSNDSLLTSYFYSNNNSLFEKHIPKEKIGNSFPDTMYYTFSKYLNDLEFSFSKPLELSKKMKIDRVLFVFNPVKNLQGDTIIPQKVYLFEIKRNAFDTDALNGFITKVDSIEKK